MHALPPDLDVSYRTCSRLVRYVVSRRQEIFTHLYKNILAGRMQYAWRRHFFSRLAEKLGKPEPQARQDFYRLEAPLYLEVLGVPRKDFEVFMGLPVPDNRNKVLHLRPSFPTQVGAGAESTSGVSLPTTERPQAGSNEAWHLPTQSSESDSAEQARTREARRFEVAREFLEDKWPVGIDHKSKWPANV